MILCDLVFLHHSFTFFFFFFFGFIGNVRHWEKNIWKNICQLKRRMIIRFDQMALQLVLSLVSCHFQYVFVCYRHVSNCFFINVLWIFSKVSVAEIRKTGSKTSSRTSSTISLDPLTLDGSDPLSHFARLDSVESDSLTGLGGDHISVNNLIISWNFCLHNLCDDC